MEPRARPDGKRLSRPVTVGTAGLLLGAVAYVGVVDPHRSHSAFPACPFKVLTGWNCPACGGLRMMHDLLHGDVAAAVVDNVFLLIGLPGMAFWVLLRMRQGKQVCTSGAMVVVAVLAITWTVVRNLPGFPLVPTILDG